MCRFQESTVKHVMNSSLNLSVYGYISVLINMTLQLSRRNIYNTIIEIIKLNIVMHTNIEYII